jgi:hypothetical protein
LCCLSFSFWSFNWRLQNQFSLIWNKRYFPKGDNFVNTYYQIFFLVIKSHIFSNFFGGWNLFVGYLKKKCLSIFSHIKNLVHNTPNKQIHYLHLPCKQTDSSNCLWYKNISIRNSKE